MTGTDAWALFLVDIPTNNVGVRAEFIRLAWSRPYSGFFHHDIQHTLDRPGSGGPHNHRPQLTFTRDLGFGNLGSNENILSQIASSGPLTPIGVLANNAIGNHVYWIVGVQDTDTASTTWPLRTATTGVIYAIKDNGDLLWYRHDGRNDGSFTWASNEGKKVGNGWNAKQVFSGGDGVIYAIKDNGDLLWYRHDGRNDGSFAWASNEGKKVGNGWTAKQVFSG